MKRLISLIMLFTLFCLFQTAAQESMNQERLYLASGEGSDFSLLRDKVKLNFTLSQVDKGSFVILQGDSLLTGQGTFLEFLSESGMIRIMVGENTNISFDTINTQQGSLFSLTQGHIHGLIEKSESNLWISGSDTVCRVTQGEFGFLLSRNVTLNQSEDKTRIYTLGGSVEVMQKKSGSTNDKRIEYNTPLTLAMGEMVITSSWERDIPLVPALFDADYSGYWKSHPFSHVKATDLAPVQPAVSVTEKPLVTIIADSPSDGEGFPINDNVQIEQASDKYKRLNDTGVAALVFGTAFMTGAALSYLLGNSSLGLGMVWMGGANLLVGAGTLSYSYFTQPLE